MKRIYLASPLGFATSTRAFMDELVRRLSEVVVVENPWATEKVTPEEWAAAEAIPDRAGHAAALHAINLRLAADNEASLRRCDAIVGVLDGVDIDSGTAAELGYAVALGKTAWGLRTDFRLAGDNHGAIVNLQVQYWIEQSGGQVVTTVDDVIAALVDWQAGSP